jgi:predicted metal-dependent hydrolase
VFRRLSPLPNAPRLRAGEVVSVSGCPVRLRVNPRARRVSLRLDAARREVTLTAPSPRKLPDALSFAESRRDWILQRLAELPTAAPFSPGRLIEVAGEPCRLEQAAMRIAPTFKAATADEPARLLASGEGERFARAVERGLRAEALARLLVRTQAHCARLGLPAPEVRLQDARTRWGSCRQGGPAGPASIRYNWRLVLAPPEVMDYVAAHECAHLVEANHGPDFWALVRRLYGDVAPARAWLKGNGARLQAVGGV